MSDLYEEKPQTEDYLKMLLLMTTRIYDVQIAILNEMNPAAAESLTEIHDGMGFLTNIPFATENEDGTAL